jgi:hypothetical protein
MTSNANQHQRFLDLTGGPQPQAKTMSHDSESNSSQSQVDGTAEDKTSQPQAQRHKRRPVRNWQLKLELVKTQTQLATVIDILVNISSLLENLERMTNSISRLQDLSAVSFIAPPGVADQCVDQQPVNANSFIATTNNLTTESDTAATGTHEVSTTGSTHLTIGSAGRNLTKGGQGHKRGGDEHGGPDKPRKLRKLRTQ